MKHIQILIKPGSSLCNLRCSYCFYTDINSMRKVRSFGCMNPEVTEKLIENVFADLEDGDSLTICFQGGEPTLVGLKYFKNFTRLVKAQFKKVIVSYAIQTNGINIDEEWCHFLQEENFLWVFPSTAGFSFMIIIAQMLPDEVPINGYW